MWSYGDPADTTKLDSPNFASRLPNGNTLIADGGNHNQVVEVAPGGGVVWTFATNGRPGASAQTDPSGAVRLANGHTLVADKGDDQILEVDAAGKIVRTVGTMGVAGGGAGQLAEPYSARVIADYTGITAPQ